LLSIAFEAFECFPELGGIAALKKLSLSSTDIEDMFSKRSTRANSSINIHDDCNKKVKRMNFQPIQRQTGNPFKCHSNRQETANKMTEYI
jgi:hypothetical protein